jgi:hypothetical protein
MTEPPADYSFTCPRCSCVGSIDEQQATGQVSIICTECDWHGYIDGRTA